MPGSTTTNHLWAQLIQERNTFPTALVATLHPVSIIVYDRRFRRPCASCPVGRWRLCLGRTVQRCSWSVGVPAAQSIGAARTVHRHGYSLVYTGRSRFAFRTAWNYSPRPWLFLSITGTCCDILRTKYNWSCVSNILDASPHPLYNSII